MRNIPALRCALAIGVAGLLAACGGGTSPTVDSLPPTADPQVIRVIDGDTLDIDGERHRFAGIDAPERYQTCIDANGSTWACGRAATELLEELVGDGPVSCTGDSQDRFGRSVSSCSAGGVDLGEALVLAGLALDEPRYEPDHSEAEDTARQNNEGMHAGRYVPPWEWRSGTRLADCEADVAVCQAENYSQTAVQWRYAPAQSGSHIVSYNFPGAEHITIGGDLEPRENLRHVLTENGIRYYIGAVRDGVGVERLRNFETDLQTRNGTDPYKLGGDTFAPFLVQPVLYWDPDLLNPENIGIAQALVDSVRILNDALPPEFQIVDGGSRAVNVALPGEIMVNLEARTDIGGICGSASAVACAVNPNTWLLGYSSRATLYLPDDFDTSEYTYPRSVIVHELLHALGIQGHVDSVEFPDSILGTAGELIPNLGHILSKIDREVLQIMYMSQITASYNDWGEWSDTSHHLVGRTEDGELNFGVALFNGLPQPWVRGGLPDTDLADNRRLSGSATWTGSLLGYSGPSPIAGDAELQVRFATLDDADNQQDLRFRDIYFLNRFESSGPDRWFPTRDIDYKVNVAGNRFVNVGGEGHVTGAFLGAGHEHMGGTVKRTDMIGAFGGTR